VLGTDDSRGHDVTDVAHCAEEVSGERYDELAWIDLSRGESDPCECSGCVPRLRTICVGLNNPRDENRDISNTGARSSPW
jgi:hypothetical protein